MKKVFLITITILMSSSFLFARSFCISEYVDKQEALLFNSFYSPGLSFIFESNLIQFPVYNQALITGKVLGSLSPIRGATVFVRDNPTVISFTDSIGNFSIKANIGDILIFNAVGYVNVERKVTSLVLEVNMQESNEILDEVVVVAYGKQKKVNMTGAVASISPKQLAERPVTSLQNALQGISPGLTVLSRPSGVRKNSNGGGTIRGRTNLDSPSPLFIIDGVPSSSNQFAALNPNDIASMSVLKDAASASLYGSRAANGVILVTTKIGGADRVTIGFSANYALKSATFLPKYANSVEYVTLFNSAQRNVGKADFFSPEIIDKYKNGSEPDLYPNTNWYKELVRSNIPQRDISLNLMAPGKVTKYYLGLNYFDQESLIPNQSQRRIDVRLNTETQAIKDILKIGSNFSFLKQDYDRAGNNINWTDVGRSLPITVSKHSDGTWGSISNGIPSAFSAGINQLRSITEGSRGTNRDNYFQGVLNGSLTPIKGLSIDGLVSLKYVYENEFDFTNTTAPVINFITKAELPSTANRISELKEYWGKSQYLLTQGTINYENHYYNHYGKITIGASQESNEYRKAFLGRRNLSSNDFTTIINGPTGDTNISSDDDGLANRTTEEDWAIRSYFGRFNYSFKDKYLFEANTRIDYSSRFAPAYRKAIFPSFSAGWNIDKESFMQNISFIDQLKIRGSWGSLGNQAVDIGNYFYSISVGSYYNFDGVAVDGAEQTRHVNYQALWEKVYMTNLGIDATFLGGKINLTADYYIKNTKNILLQPITLATLGWYKAAFANQGQTQNKGLEAMITYIGSIGNDFKYSVSGNVSYIRNKIISLGDFGENISSYFINRVGGSVRDFYGYKADGLFTSQAEIDAHPSQKTIAGNSIVGDIKYVDINGDGILNSDDRTILGNEVPWLNYGFNLAASYKKFDIDVLTYGVGGVKRYAEYDAAQPFFNSGSIKSKWLSSGWTEENNRADADFPRITSLADAPQNYIKSDFWLVSGNYFRIKAITVGYTFPSPSISKIGMSQLRVFASSNNPFTILGDKRIGDFDPETASGGSTYPGIKTFSLGVTARF